MSVPPWTSALKQESRSSSRRALVGACASLSLARLARAQEKKDDDKPEEKKKSSWKVSPESVNYIDKGPRGGGAQVCSQCHYYIDPVECVVVEGFVSPHGYCDFYVD